MRNMSASAIKAAVISTIGGTVEGHPTNVHNYLERLRELVGIESQWLKIKPPFRGVKVRARFKHQYAVGLRNQGYSYRQISKLCGWKSPRTAFVMANKKL